MDVNVVVKNCKLVGRDSVVEAGIAIDGGKIVAIARDDLLPTGRRLVDCRGNYVLPGIIDPHTHLGFRHPLEKSVRIDTEAAVFGGITTLATTLIIKNSDKFTSYEEEFIRWKSTYEQNALMDGFIHAQLDSNILEKVSISEIAEKYGVTSFKFLMAYKGEEGKELGISGIDDGDLYLSFKQIGSLGYPALAMVHAENIELIYKLKKKVKETGKGGLSEWAKTRPNEAELLDIERAISIAKITKSPLYIVHLSTKEGLEAVRKAKESGVMVFAETCPHYLTLTKDSPIGTLGKINPPLREEESREKLWEGIQRGIIDCVGTDHGSATREMKKGDIWSAALGFPGIETFLPLMLSEGVNKGRISMQKLVEVCCYNNAKVFGLYPQKGILQVGSDADLTVVDLNKVFEVSASRLHHLSDFTPYEGWKLKGWPILTMVGGQIVMEKGKSVGISRSGKYIPVVLSNLEGNCGGKEC
jgi:dihydropyrimidinase